LCLKIPSLKERPSDIRSLASYFLWKIGQEEKLGIKFFTEESILFLEKQDFPGNVRQLKNLIHRIYLHADESVIAVQEVALLCEKPILVAANDQDNFFNRNMTLDEFKRVTTRRFLLARLKKCKGNVSSAAKALGVDTSNLFRKIKELGLEW